MYFLTGAFHYALLTPGESKDILQSVERLFDDLTMRKMYLTGGLGSVKRNEGFRPDLQEGGGCYSETCTSVGLTLLYGRLLRGELKGRYADIMERALLNCVLGGIGMDGQLPCFIYL